MSTSAWQEPSRSAAYSRTAMSDAQDTIGMTELLDEVSRDLDDFRKKHPGDYNLKSITLWWDLERERLVTRHSPQTVVKNLRRARNVKRLMVWVCVGVAISQALNLITWLLLR